MILGYITTDAGSSGEGTVSAGTDLLHTVIMPYFRERTVCSVSPNFSIVILNGSARSLRI